MKTDRSVSSIKVAVGHTAPGDCTLTGVTMPACPASLIVNSAPMATYAPNVVSATSCRTGFARRRLVTWVNESNQTKLAVSLCVQPTELTWLAFFFPSSAGCLLPGQVQDPDTGECINCEVGCKTCSTGKCAGDESAAVIIFHCDT